MYKQLVRFMMLVSLGCLLYAGTATAVDFEANTPAVTRLKQNMRQRHGQLVPFYDSGAVGLTRDGLIVLRDANAVPLSGRQSVNSLWLPRIRIVTHSIVKLHWPIIIPSGKAISVRHSPSDGLHRPDQAGGISRKMVPGRENSLEWQC